MEKKNLTAVIYARVSTNGQDYDRQLNDLREYASRMGYVVIKEFAEKISGAKKVAEREALTEADKNLSNLQKIIDQAIAMSCNLGTLWKDGDFASRQKLQNLVFPSGVYFDKNIDDYRTENENEVFKVFRLFSGSCENGKEKVTTELLRLSPSVGMRRLERYFSTFFFLFPKVLCTKGFTNVKPIQRYE